MDHQADRRRRAFLEFLASRNLTRGRLTKETGISPNIVYNFMGGKSHYLSQPTLEKISAYYNVPIAVLTGEGRANKDNWPTTRRAGALNEGESSAIEVPSEKLPADTAVLDVRGQIMGSGIWMETPFSALSTPGKILLSVPHLYTASAYALKLSESAATALLPAGAFLACVAIKDYLQRPVSGDLIVAVQRNRVGLFECAVREYRVEDSRHFLVDRPRADRAEQKMALSSPLADPAALGYQDIIMHSMVLSYAANLPASSR